MRPPEDIPLRAHHLLCLLKYRGKGYSSEFVANMDRVFQALKDEKYARVEIHRGADPICGACPHLMDSSHSASCRFQDSVLERDRMLQSLMGWRDGALVPLDETLDALRQRHAELISKVCVSCEWIELCRSGDFML